MHLEPHILLTQSFGKESEYRRVILAILSAFVYIKSNIENFKVVLFTDNPDYFKKWFEGLNVEYILMTPEKIKIMRGDINFLHRMKIALIEEVFITNPKSKIFYFDSDTFFIDNPEDILNQVESNVSFMHLPEYAFIEHKDMPLPGGKTFQAFYKLIQSKDFCLANNERIKVFENEYSWNAGVMCFNYDHVRFIPDVYKLTDQFYPETENHASEQYAFSLMLQKFTTLRSCEQTVYHYWYRIKKQIIDLLLDSNWFKVLEKQPLEDKLKIIKPFILKLPYSLDNHYLTCLDNSIQTLNEDKLSEGYKWYFKAFVKHPKASISILKDVLYHTKRLI